MNKGDNNGLSVITAEEKQGFLTLSLLSDDEKPCGSSLIDLEIVESQEVNAAATTSFIVDDNLSKQLDTTVFNVKEFGSIAAVVSSIIDTGMENNSFLVCNLAAVVKQLIQWRAELPMVQPHYAVKCNPSPVIVRLLASLGCSFDCATMGEIDMVVNHLGDQLSFGRTPGKAASGIVYANPAKFDNMLQFAMDSGVRMTVFDGEDELEKIAKLVGPNGTHPGYPLQLLLRITTDDKHSICKFSGKFGCPVEEARELLVIAKELGLHVAGVSFHVGSGCRDAGAYTTALKHTAQIFNWALELGMTPMHIVDIGGGFPGESHLSAQSASNGYNCPSFHDIARVVRTSIASFCTGLNRPMDSFHFIAEPGRYFVATATTIATKVYSRKGGKQNYQALYVDNGVYGSFNTVVYDHAAPVPKKLRTELSLLNKAKSSKLNGFKGLSRTDSMSSVDSLSSMVSDMTTVASYMPPSQGNETPPREFDYSHDMGIPTAVFGPTCDGLDQMCDMENTLLDRCEVDDWLIWENQGAYTHTASFVFNGYTHVPNQMFCYQV